MKAARSSIRSMSALSVLAASALLLADRAAGQNTGTTAKSESSLSREEAAQRRAKLPFAKGTLQAHDLLRHSLKVKTEDGVRTFTYTDRTYVFRGKDKITPDKLMIGESIALSFYTEADGRVLVKRIKAYGPIDSVGTESAR
jgi:hypothetical protein